MQFMATGKIAIVSSKSIFCWAGWKYDASLWIYTQKKIIKICDFKNYGYNLCLQITITRPVGALTRFYFIAEKSDKWDMSTAEQFKKMNLLI